MCVCVCVFSLKMSLREPKQLSAICFANKVLCWMKIVPFPMFMKCNWMTHNGLHSNFVRTKPKVWLLTMEAPVRCYGRQCSICGGLAGIRTQFCLSISLSFFCRPLCHLYHPPSGGCTIHPSQPLVSQTRSTRQG